MAVYPAQAGMVAAMKAKAAESGAAPAASPSQQVLDQILARLSQPVEAPPEPPPLNMQQKLGMAFASLDRGSYRNVVAPELARRSPEYRQQQVQEAQGLDMDRLTQLHGILAGQEDASAIMAEKREAAELKAKKMSDTAALFLEQAGALMPDIQNEIASLEQSAAEFPEDASLARLLRTNLNKFNSVAAVAMQRLQGGEPVDEADLDTLQSALNDIDAAYKQVVDKRTGAIKDDRRQQASDQRHADSLAAQGDRQDRSLAATAGRAATGDNNKRFTRMMRLRDQYFKQSKSFITVGQSISNLVTAAANPSAAGDIAMIFSFMKIHDPDSVVREGEQATAANARGVPERIRSLYNRLMTGERLTEAQRDDFVGQAQNLYASQSEIQRRRQDEFRAQAAAQDLDPELTITDLTEQMETPEEFARKLGVDDRDIVVPQKVLPPGAVPVGTIKVKKPKG